MDAVNSPPHYTAGRAIEPIDAIEDWALPYHLGNVVKYVSRAGRKDDALQDLRKARWYLDRYIKRLEASHAEVSGGVSAGFGPGPGGAPHAGA